MATYVELRNLGNDATLRNRAQVAILVEANTIIRATSPTDAEVAWAKAVLASPEPWAQRALWLALAENRALSVAQLQAVSDADLQTAIAATVDALTRGEAL